MPSLLAKAPDKLKAFCWTLDRDRIFNSSGIYGIYLIHPNSKIVGGTSLERYSHLIRIKFISAPQTRPQWNIKFYTFELSSSIYWMQPIQITRSLKSGHRVNADCKYVIPKTWTGTPWSSFKKRIQYGPWLTSNCIYIEEGRIMRIEDLRSTGYSQSIMLY